MALVEKDEAGKINIGTIYKENAKGSNSSKAKGEEFIVKASS